MFRRHITSRLLAALKDTPVVFLEGARQTGKSTLIQWLIENHWPARYVTLDDLSILAAAQSDPQGFLAALDKPVALDEIQRAPDLLLAIKQVVDKDRQPGRFLLTGSANVLLTPKVSESLAGRMEIIRLMPLSQGELEGRQETFLDNLFAPRFPLIPDARIKNGIGAAALARRALAGGYPEAVQRKDANRRRAWFSSYFTTLLERDIRNLAQIEGLTQLPRLLRLLASRAGSLLNFSDLSRSLGIPQTTLKRYMTLFDSIFLTQPLEPWFVNIGKRLVKTPKIYFQDTGLLSHLSGLTGQRLAEEPLLTGALMENFAIMELMKQASWSRSRVSLYHFRSHAGDEVDLVLEDEEGRIVGIEIKASTTLGAEDFKGLKFLASAAGKHFHCGLVLYAGGQVLPFGANLYAVPLESLWY